MRVTLEDVLKGSVGERSPHNNPLATDGRKSLVMKKLLTAVEGERWAASYLGGDSASILSAGSEDL
ncbi:MAG: hypothetical protein RLZZ04_3607 [Cyanobacteriota bacterium]|jgi:hypothetical protein